MATAPRSEAAQLTILKRFLCLKIPADVDDQDSVVVTSSSISNYAKAIRYSDASFSVYHPRS